MKRFRIVFICWLLIVAQLSRPSEAEAFAWMAAAPAAPLVATAGAVALAAGTLYYFAADEGQRSAVKNAYTTGYAKAVAYGREQYAKVGLIASLANMIPQILNHAIDWPGLNDIAQSSAEYTPSGPSPLRVAMEFEATTYYMSGGVNKPVLHRVHYVGYYMDSTAADQELLSVSGGSSSFLWFTTSGAIGSSYLTGSLPWTLPGGAFDPTDYTGRVIVMERQIPDSSPSGLMDVYWALFPKIPGLLMSQISQTKFADKLQAGISLSPSVRTETSKAIAASSPTVVDPSSSDVDNPKAWQAPTDADVSTGANQQAARDAVAAAQTAVSTAEQRLAADTTNTALQQELDKARLDLANAQLAQTQADTAADSPTAEPQEDTPPSAAPAPDADVAINLSPLLGIQDKALSKFPFSLVASLAGIYSGLTAAPVTPYFMVPMPWNIPSIKCDLSQWDGFAEKWRLMLAMFFHASCIYAIVRRYT